MSSCVVICANASPCSGSSAARATRRSSRGTVNEISACPPAEMGSFWTIMSTFTFACGERLEDARGRARLVGHADERHPRLGGRMRDGCDQGLLHRLSFREHNRTGRVLERGAAVDAHAVVARVLDRAQLQHARARGRHLEHLLEGDRLQLARIGHDPRVGRCTRRRRRCRSRTPPRPAPPRPPPRSCPSRRDRAS